MRLLRVSTERRAVQGIETTRMPLAESVRARGVVFSTEQPAWREGTIAHIQDGFEDSGLEVKILTRTDLFPVET